MVLLHTHRSHHDGAAYASIASWSCCICSSCIMTAPHMARRLLSCGRCIMVVVHVARDLLSCGRCIMAAPHMLVLHYDRRVYGTPPAIGHAPPASCKRHKLPYIGKACRIHPAKLADFRGTGFAPAPGGGRPAAWHASCFLFSSGRHDGAARKTKKEKKANERHDHHRPGRLRRRHRRPPRRRRRRRRKKRAR
jgi:hypothetical protein